MTKPKQNPKPEPSAKPRSTHELESKPRLPQSTNGERLNKYLAFHLGVSRRQADEIIAKKTITINDQPATLGARVMADDMVAINGQLVGRRKNHTYLMLNKPPGYVCSRKQQGNTPTIYSLLPAKYHNLKPVGRLDGNSSGLILLTDDGDLAYQLTHPKFKKTKRYLVEINDELQPLHQQMIADFGVRLDDGVSQLGLTRQSEENRRQWIVTMKEGRNRQIRRTFGALGYMVIKLHRTNFGRYSLGKLNAGEWALINHKK